MSEQCKILPECSSYFSSLDAKLSVLEKQAIELDFYRKSCEERLHDGHQEFERIRSEIKEISERQKPPSLLRLAAFIVPLLLVAGSWIFAIASHTTSDDVRKIIAAESPYVLDRSKIESNLSELAAIRAELRDLTIQQAQIVERLDLLLERR